MKTLTIFLSFYCVFFNDGFGNSRLSNPEKKSEEVAIVSYVSDYNQMRKAKALIKSIRNFSGECQQCPILIALDNTSSYPFQQLKMPGVELFFLNLDESFSRYPFASKAFAMARAEELVNKNTSTLIWIDPESLVVNSLRDFILTKNEEIALRPVSLNNNIGIKPGSEPDEYWNRILEMAGVDFKDLPIIKTSVDEVEVKSYLNCQIYAINPKLGLGKKWIDILSELIMDNDFQKGPCNGYFQKVFLHQVVFTAIVNAEIKPEKIKSLPLRSNYPLNLHKKLSQEKKAGSFNHLHVISTDIMWDYYPDWMEWVPVQGQLKSWLENAYLEYIKITENLYRFEGESNSYLITTQQGSVLIDPKGASDYPVWFERIIKEHPLKAILITHGHADHRSNVDFWKGELDIPVIAQREFKDFVRYQDMFARYYARRNAIWNHRLFDEDSIVDVQTPIDPNIFFADQYEYELGGYHFKLIHTPGETPDATTIWVPELESVFVGDNYYDFFPNIYTLRGTPHRPVTGYIAAMDSALAFNPVYFCMGHRTPLVGKSYIKEKVQNFRDVLQYIHDETVQGINDGKDVYTLMQEIDFPDIYEPVPEYFGKVDWAVRGIYDGYVGWFDGNPVNMYSLPVSSVFPELTELAGGTDRIAELAGELFAQGELIKALHLTEVALSGDPNNKNTLEIRLNILETLRKGPYNYVEYIFLDEAIRKAKEALE